MAVATYAPALAHTFGLVPQPPAPFGAASRHSPRSLHPIYPSLFNPTPVPTVGHKSLYPSPAPHSTLALRDLPPFKSIDPLTLEQHLTLMADLAGRAALYLWYDTFYPNIPLDSFHKFVHQVLKSTSLSSSVVLLALKYIHRFKTGLIYREVKKGSEFRVFTVALMLASKFLEDNTFTTKTWAEVSGLPFKELHRIQVEFLNTLNHNLYVSGVEYFDWLHSLSRLVHQESSHFQYPRASRQVLSAFVQEGPAEVNGISCSPVERKRPSPALLSPLAHGFATPNPSPYLGRPASSPVAPHRRSSLAYTADLPQHLMAYPHTSKRRCVLSATTGALAAVPTPNSSYHYVPATVAALTPNELPVSRSNYSGDALVPASTSTAFHGSLPDTSSSVFTATANSFQNMSIDYNPGHPRSNYSRSTTAQANAVPTAESYTNAYHTPEASVYDSTHHSSQYSPAVSHLSYHHHQQQQPSSAFAKTAPVAHHRDSLAAYPQFHHAQHQYQQVPSMNTMVQTLNHPYPPEVHTGYPSVYPLDHFGYTTANATHPTVSFGADRSFRW
ncbi:hypothetical protein BJ085DRAFT_36827 [Dimargaris cristalligena]|uniref:Cyclin-domain-containing protein n=1 Tax=Dimargaris cristalligena TaxID=215637 RepID=A0A4P9ZXS7_9FUNG|nr:hypothetical protein BJ085DRAFT_36827 [Dimargaris cristalligena]|eukprot:RKP38476.1 hypothetical protein BJ085DRAFT_36827 [Dimargaris cristalligena]